MRFLAALLLPWLAAACAPAKTPLDPSPQPVAVAAKAQGPRERLVEALRAIPRPEPVLSALPLAAQQRLKERLAGLDAERRLAVHSEDSPLLESLPLLHLMSGGSSPRALYALTTTSAGTEELAGLLGVEPSIAGASPDAARVALVGELTQRAALDFLRDRAVDVAQPSKGSALACRLVARAALSIGRSDLVLLARELLLSVEPNSENRLEFARELARAGEVSRAEQAFAEAQAEKRHPASPGSLADARRLIDASRAANSKPAGPPSTASNLARARAWLYLGRVAEARALLEGEAASARARLDVAAATAEAWIGIPACPGLPLDVGTPQLCAAAFRESERVLAARALLAAAWQSGLGRDDEAVEVYTALEYVIPWMQETATDISRGALSAEESTARVATLHAKLAEIAGVAPRMAGLALFLQTVHSGPSQRVAGLRSKEDAAALSARALVLASTDSSRFAQAGVLAVAAALSHQSDISLLLDLWPPEETDPSLRVARAALEVWVAVSLSNRERMSNARGELAAIMSEGQGSSIERARLVLTVSEADALLDPTERSYQLLSRVSGQLLNENIPPDLALRAVLDASGALAHGGRLEQADKILNGAVHADLPPDLERAGDLLQLIRGYQLVLAAHGAPATSLPRIQGELKALAVEPRAPATTVWFELWARELDALAHDATCAKKKQAPCREADKLRHEARSGLDQRLGGMAGAILAHGALPSGSFDAGFRFTIERGLEPLIIFDPNFLAVGLPRLAGE